VRFVGRFFEEIREMPLTSFSSTLRRYARLPNVVAMIIAFQVLALAQASQNAARPDRGISPNGNFAISDIENINLTNGNVNLSVPLASLPPIARGKLSLTVRAIYNSKSWDIKREEISTDHPPGSVRYVKDVIQYSENGGWSIGAGYGIVFQSFTENDFGWLGPEVDEIDYTFFAEHPPQNWVKVQFLTPDGATHELRPMEYSPYLGQRDFLRGYYWETPDKIGGPMRYYSSDGSFIWAKLYQSTNSTLWEVYLPDGTRIRQKTGFQDIKDTNGNTIKIFTEEPTPGTLTTHYKIQWRLGSSEKSLIRLEAATPTRLRTRKLMALPPP
jgi:hypothetical protein